jgi:hypothetical protein
LYSKVAIDRDAPLPPALDAERTAFTSEKSGAITYYMDRSQQGRPLVLIHSVNAAASAMEMSPLFNHYRQHAPGVCAGFARIWLFGTDQPGIYA